MGSAEVVVDVVVEDLVAAAEAVVEVEGVVEADQEIGRAKTAATPTLPGGTCATSVRHQSLEVEVVVVEAVAEVEVEALAAVGTGMGVIGTEVGEVTDTEVVVEDMTEIGMEVEDMVVAVEVLTEEAMVGTGIDHTDCDNPRWRNNYTATHSALFLFSCNVNTTYRCV